ncbi:hypothetical protein [Amycolatopsis nigrescens]|uniref:hypothetical protein n=1 Tax=Amycolatopsis nigrescens TaxID=381445 RepID=UPI00036D06FE|nr:hypothetical protein [Amycolatopsis nigrescens]
MSVDRPASGTAGTTALLRVAGLPAAVPAAAGSPELFDQVRSQIRAEAAYRDFTKALADRVGQELVPQPHLTTALRRSAIELRRRLHRGEFVDRGSCTRLAAAGRTLGASGDLGTDLLLAGAWSTELVTRDGELLAALDNAERRLLELPWELVTGDEAVRRMMTATAPALIGEIRGRLAAGERWTGKRMRKRADYLLRLLSRAALKSTPRGWLGQVALVDLAPGPMDTLVDELTVGEFAVHRLSNIQGDRRALAAEAGLPEAWLSLAAPSWVEGDRLCCRVADHDSADGMRQILVRLTPAVDAVRRVLGARALRATEVLARLVPAADERSRTVLRDFLHHLVRLGVVQISAEPVGRLESWTANPSGEATGSGFADVYRRVSGHVSATAAARLPELLAQANRLAEVLAHGGHDQPHPALQLVGAHPRPVTEIFAEFLRDHETEPVEPPSSSWPRPRPGTAYQRLCDWLTAQDGAAEIDIDRTVLDEIGAPPAARPRWPVDCLLRPLRKPLAVLEAVVPAGVVDARFAGALRALHGQVRQVDDYRAFLEATAAEGEAEFVEILVPPQGHQGANTVRRPCYTRTWTGDADPSTYLDDHANARRYLPLERITLRRHEGRVIAEDLDGGLLWPVYHATRRPPPPWDTLVPLLTAAAPASRLATPRLFGDPTAVFPLRAGTPRLLLDGELVVAPGSVRVGRDLLPRPGADFGARARALANLRPATGAPRWNLVRADGGRRSRPVDLDSLAALRIFDRLLDDPAVSRLVLEEMLPAPGRLPVLDEHGAQLAAQLLIRLPLTTSPARLATQAVAAWHEVTTTENPMLPRPRSDSSLAPPQPVGK